MTRHLHDLVADVVSRDACSGCGLCTRLDPSLRMELDGAGYLRPRPRGASEPVPDAAAIFRSACPGMTVRAPKIERAATKHALLGAHRGIWLAWAADPDLRHAGSSGGALTAIQSWLLESGRATSVAAAAMDAAAPRRSVPVTIMSREDALRAAGSRYAPVAGLDNTAVLTPDGAFVGKPCEAAALRQAAPRLIEGGEPLLLSFFCAGTPSQHATDAVLQELGVDRSEPLSSLRYRGDGWPGRFSAHSDSTTVSTDYETSWGRHLGPTTQWRCKLCVDGTGEAADIVAADAWDADEEGYPIFEGADGRSALLARTVRGRGIILAAEQAGAIVLEPFDIERLAAVQPLQTARRRFLSARLLGARLGGRRPPTYPGYRLLHLALSEPRTALRALRGTFERVLRARRHR